MFSFLRSHNDRQHGQSGDVSDNEYKNSLHTFLLATDLSGERETRQPERDDVPEVAGHAGPCCDLSGLLFVSILWQDRHSFSVFMARPVFGAP